MQLVLDKYGISLGLEDGMFKVQHKEGSRKIPVGKIKSIFLQRSASITTDAIFEAIENEIDITLINKFGMPVGKVWSHKFGSISTIRKNQVHFAESAQGARWVIEQLQKKLENQTAMIIALGKPDDIHEKLRTQTIKNIEKHIDKMNELNPSTISEVEKTLRGWEGTCSRAYFHCINAHLPGQYKFSQRSQHPALDMFNAMLNYTYGILYSKIEAALVTAGIDPYAGIMHRDEYNKPVLVYDTIEGFRVWADFVVIDLCMQQVIFLEFFDREGQVFLLNTSGKKILIQSFNDYMEEIITVKGLARSRNEHINVFAKSLATKLKQLKP